MKPKTIKELESRTKDLEFKDDYIIRESDLRQELIKWIKHYCKLALTENTNYNLNKAEGLQEFLNIIGGDLK